MASNKREAKQQYDELRIRPEFAQLPQVRSADDALQALDSFEQTHPEACQHHRDDGQFFGFAEVAQGYLGRFTRFLLIPAVRDASADALEGRGSAITTLMDMVVRNALAGREDLKKLKDETQQRYEQLMEPQNLPELGQVEHDLTTTLQTFIPDAAVDLSWSGMGEIEIPMPRAVVKLFEHGYPSAVMNTGHGLQRAFILTMLHRLALEQANPRDADTTNEQQIDNSETQVPSLVLGIEEPELFQHPNRQRHFAVILRDLAAGTISGVAQKTQVVYTTHSSYFVGIDRFEQIRVFHKVLNGEDAPKVTRVTQVTGDSVAHELGRAWEPDKEDHGFSWNSVRPSLRLIMTPMLNEGLFADVVVLVEGEEDRAMILGVAQVMGYDLERDGIPIIPCGGKANIDRPLVIFRHFGIKPFVVWDGDYGRENGRHPNLRLLRLLGQEAVDFPPTTVTPTFACFKYTMGRILREEVGERQYAQISQSCHQNLLVPVRDEPKNPSVVAYMIQEAGRLGLKCRTLERVVNSITAIRPGQ